MQEVKQTRPPVSGRPRGDSPTPRRPTQRNSGVGAWRLACLVARIACRARRGLTRVVTAARIAIAQSGGSMLRIDRFAWALILAAVFMAVGAAAPPAAWGQINHAPLYTFFGDSPGDEFGFAVSGAGDVN